MSISAELGEAKEVRLPQSTIRYRERGSGEPIVFVHGVMVNGDIWRKVVPLLAGEFRCIAPDWPLGGHEVALHKDAEITPASFAKLTDDFFQALSLNGITLVGNDTGGALCQMTITEYPDRIARLVLTTCDAYENFPPRVFRNFTWTAALPGTMFLLAQSLRPGFMRRAFFSLVAKRPVEPEILESYLGPLTSDAAVRRDLKKAMLNASSRDTLAAAKKFGQFHKPVLIAWTPEDRFFFNWKYAERLRNDFPNARLESIEDSHVFVSEDQPERLAELITAFMHETKEATV